MKNRKVLLFAIPLIFLMACNGSETKKQSADTKKDTVCKNDDWKLAVQAWSFHKFSFCEAVDKAKKAGFKYMEAYPGQKVYKDKEQSTYFTMGEELKQFIKDTLSKAGIELVAYGVVKCDSAYKWEQVFSFAKDMGIQTITAEPKEEHMSKVEELTEKYGISLAIHNHPTPSHYWHPDSVLEVCEGRNDLVGACADNGHWTRSGLDVQECMNKLSGRIISLHLKDMHEKGNLKAHTVPFGTGVNDVKSILSTLKEQNFKGVITVEYEHNWEDNVEDIKQCKKYYQKSLSEL